MTALLEPLEERLLLSAGLLITEFMTDDDRTLDDGDAVGRFPDWIEIHNPTNDTVGPDGWYLTDKDDDRAVGDRPGPADFPRLPETTGGQGFSTADFRFGTRNRKSSIDTRPARRAPRSPKAPMFRPHRNSSPTSRRA